MDSKKTQRGFSYIEFKDSYGAECSLQESSNVDPSIWLGMDKDHQGNATGPMVDGKQLGARMHLSQNDVIKLLPHLQFFARHAYLPDANEIISKKTTMITQNADGDNHIVVRMSEYQAWDFVSSLLRQLREEYEPQLTFMASLAELPESAAPKTED